LLSAVSKANLVDLLSKKQFAAAAANILLFDDGISRRWDCNNEYVNKPLYGFSHLIPTLAR
jgi:hypothetical protein